MKKPYRFSIKKNSTTYYAVTPSGAVVEQSIPYYIGTPIGWNKTEVTAGRSRKYWGYDRTYTDKYDFWGDGAKIMRHVKYNIGTHSIIEIYIELLNTTTQQYEYLNSLMVNFNTAVDKFLTFETELLQYGIEGLIKDNEDVVYDIAMTPSLVDTIAVPPMYLQGELKYVTGWPIPSQGTNTNAFAVTAAAYKNYLIHVSSTVVKLGQGANNEPISITDPSLNNQVTGQNFETITGGGTYALNSNIMFKANTPLKKVRVQGTIAFNVDNQTGANAKFKVWLNLLDASNNLQTKFYEALSPTLINGVPQNFAITIDTGYFDMPANYKLIMQHTIEPNGSNYDHNVAWEKDSDISVTFQHFTNSFDVRGVRLHRVGEQLVSMMTAGAATMQSDMLTNPDESPARLMEWVDTIPRSAFVTCGDAIRGINSPGYSTPVIKTSFKDFFNFIDTVFNGGMGLEGNKVRIEKKKYFFNPGITIANLGNIDKRDWNIETANEYLFNTINAGYDTYDYDGLNGRYEFNNGKSIWKIPGKNRKSELDLTTRWRTDMTGVFFTWADYSPSETTDSTSDNDVFVIDAVYNNATGKYKPRQLSGTVSGVLDASTVMNAAYSPKHKLWRNGNRLRISTIGQETGYLTMLSADRNRDLYVNYGNGGANYGNEDYDIPIVSMEQPLFRPEFINTNVVPPRSYLNRIDDANYKWGVFTQVVNGHIVSGHPVDTGYFPSPETKNRYKLLMSYVQDITIFVR